VYGSGYPTPLWTDIWHLVGGRSAAVPYGGGAGIFFDDFLTGFAKNFLVFIDRILGNTGFQKPESFFLI